MRPRVKPSARAHDRINGRSDAHRHTVSKAAVSPLRRRFVRHDNEQVVVAVRPVVAPRGGAEQVYAFRLVRRNEPADHLGEFRLPFEDGVGHVLSYLTTVRCLAFATVMHRSTQPITPIPSRAKQNRPAHWTIEYQDRVRVAALASILSL